MNNKYIKQIDSQNFVYPNYELTEYDIEINHNINNNSATGTITSLNLTSISITGMTFQFDYTWNLNGGEPFINSANQVNVLSVHMMTPNKQYYKPFRLVKMFSVPTGTTQSISTETFSVTASQLGVPYFETGLYNFEFRFIDHKSIYTVCGGYEISFVPSTLNWSLSEAVSNEDYFIDCNLRIDYTDTSGNIQILERFSPASGSLIVMPGSSVTAQSFSIGPARDVNIPLSAANVNLNVTGSLTTTGIIPYTDTFNTFVAAKTFTAAPSSGYTINAYTSVTLP